MTLDFNTADVRFLQAQRHGKVLTPVEFADEHRGQLAEHWIKAMTPIVLEISVWVTAVVYGEASLLKYFPEMP